MQGAPQTHCDNQPLLEKLFAEFNRYRSCTVNVWKLRNAGKYIPDISPTGKKGKEVLAALAEMVAICQKHSLDPHLFLYTLFDVRKWLFTPPTARIASLKHAERMKKEAKAPMPTGYARQVQREVLDARADTNHDPNRDLTASAEHLKHRFVQTGDYQRCMDLMMTQTFGYHPKSQVCAGCPVSSLCVQKLQGSVQFDIMALREGRITSQQARETAYRVRAHIR